MSGLYQGPNAPPKPEPSWLSKALKKTFSLDPQPDSSLAEEAVDLGAGFVPGATIPMAARDYVRADKEDDTLGKGLAIVSALPGGHLLKGLRKGAQRSGLIASKGSKEVTQAMEHAQDLHVKGEPVQKQWEETGRQAFVDPKTGIPQNWVDTTGMKIHHDFNTQPYTAFEKQLDRTIEFPNAKDFWTNHPELGKSDLIAHLKQHKPGTERDFSGVFAPSKGPYEPHLLHAEFNDLDAGKDIIRHEVGHGVAHDVEGMSKGASSKPKTMAHSLAMRDFLLADPSRASRKPTQEELQWIAQRRHQYYEDNWGETLARAGENPKPRSQMIVNPIDSLPKPHIENWHEDDFGSFFAKALRKP
jgi:hypothetical protein